MLEAVKQTTEKEAEAAVAQLKAILEENSIRYTVSNRCQQGALQGQENEDIGREALREVLEQEVLRAKHSREVVQWETLKHETQELQKAVATRGEKLLALLRKGSLNNSDQMLAVTLGQGINEAAFEASSLRRAFIKKEEQLVQLREQWEPLIAKASALFLCVRDLQALSRLYAFSLRDYLKIFSAVVSQPGTASSVES